MPLVTMHTVSSQGRGSGQVVSVVAYYSDDPSSNPADAYSFSVKFVFKKNENKQKRPRLAHFCKNIVSRYLVRSKFVSKLFRRNGEKYLIELQSAMIGRSNSSSSSREGILFHFPM